MVVLNMYTCWLLFLSIYDAYRGLMHTFLYQQAAKIAGFDFSQQKDNQILLMTAFGTGNYLTGAIFLFIVFQAPELAPHIIGLIGFTYLFSFTVVSNSLNIKPKGKFPGKTVMKIISFICCMMYLGYGLQLMIHKKV